MGKKAKKAAAARAAKTKTEDRADEQRSKMKKQCATVCTGSKPPERHRHRRVEGTEFFRVASLFGIAGDHPNEVDFKHPEFSWPHQKIPEKSSNPIYNALWEAIPHECDIYHKYRRAFAAGKAPFPMSLDHACRNMTLNALSRLQHKRKQRKHRCKKIAEKNTVPVL